MKSVTLLPELAATEVLGKMRTYSIANEHRNILGIVVLIKSEHDQQITNDVH